MGDLMCKNNSNLNKKYIPGVIRTPENYLKTKESIKNDNNIGIEQNELLLSLFHEIKNPINSSLAGSEYLSRFLTDIENQKIHQDDLSKLNNAIKASNLVIEGLKRINKIVSNYQDSTLNKKLNYKDFCFKEAVESSIRLLNGKIKANKIKVINDLEDLPEIKAIPGKLEQVFTNIIANSIDAMPNGGILDIRAKLNKGYLEIIFSDTGTGISEIDLEMIFEPYYSTKSKSDNFGLGLYISKNIIEEHAGEINYIKKSKGAAFKIQLPVK